MRPQPAAPDKPEATPNNKPKSDTTVADAVVVVYSTYPDHATAETIGTALVDLHLVACANILPPMTSIYHWNSERQRDAEVAMLLKTRASLGQRLIAEIKARHPYENPAILLFHPSGGSPPFLEWIMAQTAETAETADMSVGTLDDPS
ncbi:MAG: divalent-cation tolerance protein CutA [Hyphomicrobiaceae bacterium]|nr:divalent-cation tolerance protein CutA [Hyphomicrobiaceae bacterium]